MGEVKMTVAARSDVGRARDNNEDAFTVVDLASGARLETGAGAGAIDVGEKGALLALSDGMGGHQAGEVASALVLDSLSASMKADGGGSIDKKIEAAVQRANADVAQAARLQNKRGMGATLTAVFVEGEHAYVAEVGDSRAYLLRSGTLRQITRDQSFAQMLADSGVLSEEEARRSPQKSVILQAMGHGSDVRVAIGRLHLRRGDLVMLCCDGLSNAVSDDELRDILSARSPSDACVRLVDLANERGGEDNLTTIVARFDGDGLPAPSPDEPAAKALEVLQEFTSEPNKQAAEARPPSTAPRAATKREVAPAAPAPAVAAPRAGPPIATWILLGALAVGVLGFAVYWLSNR